MIGSWSKRKGFNNAVKQSLKKSSKETVADEASDIAANTGKNWIASKLKPTLQIGKGIVGGPVFEMEQEMFQEATSVHLNRRSANRLNSYYGEIIDKDGIDYVGNGMRNFVEAVIDTHTDKEKWENGAIGFLTALLPMPMKTMTAPQNTVTHDETGNPVKDGINKIKERWTVGGELWETIRNAREGYREADALAKALNDLESDGRRLG